MWPFSKSSREEVIVPWEGLMFFPDDTLTAYEHWLWAWLHDRSRRVATKQLIRDWESLPASFMRHMKPINMDKV